MTCRQTSCRHCGLDIEGFSPYRAGEWRDRGNNTHCPDNSGRAHAGSLLSSRVHAPFIEHATRRESGRAAVAECVRGREQELIPAVMRPPLFETLADGLDASTDGRGWGAEHENARVLANAAPALEGFARYVASMTPYEPGSTDDFDDAMTTMNHLIEKAQQVLAGGGLQVPKK